MSLIPMKCKLCGKIIEPPEILIGEPEGKRKQRTVRKLMKHMEERVETEAKSGRGGPHLEATQKAAMRCNLIAANLNGVFLTEHFEMPEDLQSDRQALLRDVHEMTRQVRVSDEELMRMLDGCTVTIGTGFSTPSMHAEDVLKDLRDRYESLGKYAPAAPNAPSPDHMPTDVNIPNPKQG